MMNELNRDCAHLWYSPQLDGLALYRATIVKHAFKRHAHDTYVIGLVETGVQKFACQREQFTTLPGGIIIINPAEAHTGEAALPGGFRYRAFYPSVDQMREMAQQGGECQVGMPFFTHRIIHDPVLFAEINALHSLLEESSVPSLEIQGRFQWALTALIGRYSELSVHLPSTGRGHDEIRRVLAYLEACYADDVTLDDLAALVHWSPFHLLRTFRRATGLPPHAYLEGVQVRRAQRLIQQGVPLVQVAGETGFSSQSHFTTTFRRWFGVTPGAYRHAVNPLAKRAIF